MIYIYKPRSEWHRRFDLTENKSYDCERNGQMVYSSDGIYFKLISDLGNEIEVHESHFIPLDKFREGKLKEMSGERTICTTFILGLFGFIIIYFLFIYT